MAQAVLPSSAVRDQELGGFAVGPLDSEGRRDGECVVFRDDGSLLLRGHFRKGLRVGHFIGYHPNGDVASEGSYVDGKLDGDFVRYASEGAGSAPLRSCCVPPGARQLRLRYRDGRVVNERFFDEAGNALRSDGRCLPERPLALPVDADFDESSERWAERVDTSKTTARYRYFDLEGKCVEEVQMRQGKRIARRTYAAEALIEECHFDDEGRLCGEYSKRHAEPGGPYLDPAIVLEKGLFERGYVVGRWSFFSASGQLLRTVDRGSALTDAQLGVLIQAPLEESTGVREQARVLRSDGRLREALWLLARDGDRGELSTLLAEVVVPLAPKSLEAWTRVLSQGSKVRLHTALEALLCGARPAQVFRVIAALLPEGSAAARDFIETSLLFEPESAESCLTHGMISLDSGDVAAALADAAQLNARADGAGAGLATEARILFQTAAFTPDREALPPLNPELPEAEAQQSLAAVCSTFTLYATRLALLRAKLVQAGCADAVWLPPDLTALCGGPVALRKFTATIEDETADGAESSEVEIDETLGLELSSARGLMTTARADWDALCWLCWAAGLDSVALPSALKQRAHFAAVVNEVMVRCWRAHDQVRTGGLVARSRAFPSFDWEGLPIGSLSRSLALVAAAQYLERRAMFFWILFPQNVSPFQSDLRKV